MGATASEKILARVGGVKSTKPGDVVYPEPDYIILHDLHAHIFLRDLWNLGLKELWKPERVVVVISRTGVRLMSSQTAISASSMR